MLIKGILFEDFVNYKKPCMVLEFPYCSFKCGSDVCQNYQMQEILPINVPIDTLIERYLSNPITEAIVMQGLEPFDSFNDLYDFIEELRQYSSDDIVIYTGYNFDEIKDKVLSLKQFENIIIKFGRYIPNDTKKYDEVLGVTLASSNQYAINIKDIKE